jgi:two-component system, chemotaxis family, chemotaxis protein CheY
MAFNVLIVDDSAVMRAMIVRTLKMSGVPIASIHEAAHGEEGLHRLQEEWIDLVLLDINMPVMNGEEMLTRIRADERTRDLAVIVVSTEGSETRLAALQAMGAVIVHKPFPPEVLRNTILHVTGVTDVEYYGPIAATSDSVDF